MARRSNRYHMLVASLPALPAQLAVTPPAMAAERLQNRLRMLEPEDAAEVERLRAVLAWANQFDEADDARIVKRYGALMQGIENPLVREILEYGADVRMVAVALRARRLDAELPRFGLGRWANHLRRHFKEPGFALGRAVPWLAEAEQLLANGELLSLYRKAVLGVTWDLLRKRAEAHHFDFEAVVLYIGRWDCLRRWQQLDEERGREIFETLVTETLGEYANAYA